MTNIIDISVVALPDVGEIGPDHRHLFHRLCKSRIHIRTNAATRISNLVCAKCGWLCVASTTALDLIDKVAILQNGVETVLCDNGGRGPDVLLRFIPHG